MHFFVQSSSLQSSANSSLHLPSAAVPGSSSASVSAYDDIDDDDAHTPPMSFFSCHNVSLSLSGSSHSDSTAGSAKVKVSRDQKLVCII